MSEKARTVELREKVRIKCFCGLWLSAGETGDGEPYVVHPVPACQRYLDTEPADFLQALRKKYSP